MYWVFNSMFLLLVFWFVKEDELQQGHTVSPLELLMLSMEVFMLCCHLWFADWNFSSCYVSVKAFTLCFHFYFVYWDWSPCYRVFLSSSLVNLGKLLVELYLRFPLEDVDKEDIRLFGFRYRNPKNWPSEFQGWVVSTNSITFFNHSMWDSRCLYFVRMVILRVLD